MYVILLTNQFSPYKSFDAASVELFERKGLDTLNEDTRIGILEREGLGVYSFLRDVENGQPKNGLTLSKLKLH